MRAVGTEVAGMFQFDVAVSYAGEEEGIAGDLHRLLVENGLAVFFARAERSRLVGKRLASEFSHAFGPGTRFVVAIVSRHYPEKRWTRYEFEVARHEGARRPSEFILPVRLDDVELEGLDPDVGYVDLRKEGLFGTVKIIIDKLRAPRALEGRTLPTVWVATFGVNTEELLESEELPASAPRYYPFLYDWLEEDLMHRLAKTRIGPFQFLEDLRTGETLSIRVNFEWDPVKQPLDFGDMAWWEVLEVADFAEIYPARGTGNEQGG